MDTMPGAIGLKDAIDLLQKQTSTINGLWTVYVAATFAASGFAIAGAREQKYAAAIALTIGFGAFTVGHWNMLRPELEARWALKVAIMAHLEADASAHKNSFYPSIRRIAETVYETGWSRFAHFLIDACVFASIWIQAAGRAAQ